MAQQKLKNSQEDSGNESDFSLQWEKGNVPPPRRSKRIQSDDHYKSSPNVEVRDISGVESENKNVNDTVHSKDLDSQKPNGLSIEGLISMQNLQMSADSSSIMSGSPSMTKPEVIEPITLTPEDLVPWSFEKPHQWIAAEEYGSNFTKSSMSPLQAKKKLEAVLDQLVNENKLDYTSNGYEFFIRWFDDENNRFVETRLTIWENNPDWKEIKTKSIVYMTKQNCNNGFGTTDPFAYYDFLQIIMVHFINEDDEKEPKDFDLESLDMPEDYFKDDDPSEDLSEVSEIDDVKNIFAEVDDEQQYSDGELVTGLLKQCCQWNRDILDDDELNGDRDVIQITENEELEILETPLQFGIDHDVTFLLANLKDEQVEILAKLPNFDVLKDIFECIDQNYKFYVHAIRNLLRLTEKLLTKSQINGATLKVDKNKYKKKLINLKNTWAKGEIRKLGIREIRFIKSQQICRQADKCLAALEKL